MIEFPENPLKTQELLEFMTSDETLQMPDKIEKVDDEELFEMIQEDEFVAALFYEEGSDKSDQVLGMLEKIDDEAELFGYGTMFRM